MKPKKDIDESKTSKRIHESAMRTHKTWHQFSGWLMKAYGKDLYSEYQYWEFVDENGKKKKFKNRHFDEVELSRRLAGPDVIKKIENYVKKYCPEIKIVHCDDAIYSGSIILLIPHPEHGITVMFIPQQTGIQNQFFLYWGHYENLMKELKKMKKVYEESLSYIVDKGMKKKSKDKTI